MSTNLRSMPLSELVIRVARSVDNTTPECVELNRREERHYWPDKEATVFAPASIVMKWDGLTKLQNDQRCYKCNENMESGGIAYGGVKTITVSTGGHGSSCVAQCQACGDPRPANHQENGGVKICGAKLPNGAPCGAPGPTNLCGAVHADEMERVYQIRDIIASADAIAFASGRTGALDGALRAYGLMKARGWVK